MTEGRPVTGDIRGALAACTVLNLAYVDEDGGPQACAVFYAQAADGSPVFVGSRSTRHGRVLAADPDGVPVAFTAQNDDQTWRTLRGVQGRGVCHRLAGAELEAARETYLARFPFVTADDRLARALAAADHWCIRPTWLRLIDNSRGSATRPSGRTPPADDGQDDADADDDAAAERRTPQTVIGSGALMSATRIAQPSYR